VEPGRQGTLLYRLDVFGDFGSGQRAGRRVVLGAPQTLITRINLATVPSFAVSPDGKKILVERLSQKVNQSVTLVTNFAESLNKAR
jgi:hypothetical protein